MFREQTLPKHHLNPRVRAKQIRQIRPHIAVFLKELYAVREAVRDIHGTIKIPEFTVIPLRLLVVQDDKIAHRLPFNPGFTIKVLGQRRHCA